MVSEIIPSNWALYSIAGLNVGEVSMLNPTKFPDEEFEYYSIPAYQNAETPEMTKGRDILSQKLLIPEVCVLFGKLNPRVEKVWNVKSYNPSRRIASTEWLPIMPKPGIDQDYVYFLMHSKWVMPIAQTLVSGSTPSRQRVDPDAFYKILVPVPELDEQQAISAALSQVRDAIGVQGQSIAVAQDLKRAAMRTLFTRGLRGEAQRETEIGPVPESWEVVSIENSIRPYRFNRGIQVPRSAYATTGTWPIIDQGQEFIAGYIDDQKRIVRPECPIIIFGDHTRVFKFVDFDFALGADGTKPLLAEDGFDSKYLYYSFSNLDVPSRGYNRHYRVLIQMHIKKPSLAEQQEIAAILEAIDRKIDLHRRKRAVLEELFRALLHKLMTGEIRVGELGTVGAGENSDDQKAPEPIGDLV